MESQNKDVPEILITIEFRKNKRLITNYEPLFYFLVCAPVFVMIFCLKSCEDPSMSLVIHCAGN